MITLTPTRVMMLLSAYSALLMLARADDKTNMVSNQDSWMVFDEYRNPSGGFARSYDGRECPAPYFSGNSFEVLDHWPDGANMEITVRPSGPVENGWTMLVVFSRNLPKGAKILVWNAEVTAKTEGRYVTLVNRAHNPNLNNIRVFSLTLVVEGATMEDMSGFSAMVSFYNERIKDAACYLRGSRNKKPSTTNRPPTTPRTNPVRRTTIAPRRTTRKAPRTERPKPPTTTRRPITKRPKTTRRTTTRRQMKTRPTTTTRRPKTTRRTTTTRRPSTTQRAKTERPTEEPKYVDENAPEYKKSNKMIQMHKGRCKVLSRGYEIQNTGYDAGNDLADGEGRKYRCNVGIVIPVKESVSDWTIKIVFAEPVESIQVWEAVASEHSSDGRVWLIRPQAWNSLLTETFEFLLIPLMRVKFAPPAIVYLCEDGEEPTLLGNGIFKRKDGGGETLTPEEIEEQERQERERQEQFQKEREQREREQKGREKEQREREQNEKEQRENGNKHSTTTTRNIQSVRPATTTTARPRISGPRCSGSDGYAPSNPKQAKVSFKRSPSKERSPYDYNEVLAMSIMFYEAQRSGKLPSNNRINWRGDSGLKDGCDVGHDLTGGWYDAGDHVKFGFPMAWSATTLAWGAIEFLDAYKDANEYKNMLSTLKWVADYFVKAHTSKYEFYGQVGDGGVDHSYWGKAEDMNMRRPAFKIDARNPGSEVAAETAAALSAISIVFKKENPSYSKLLLRHAEELYELADRYRGEYQKSITNAQGYYRSYNGYDDELVWGALWLAKATGKKSYLDEGIRKYSQYGGDSTPKMFSWDDKRAGSQVLIAELTGEGKYRNHIMGYQNFLMNHVPKTPKGMIWLDKWGSNRYTANAMMISLAAANLKPPMREKSQLIQFARKQIHLLLGDAGRSYVVGYGKNPPIRPHHRSSSCPPNPTECNWNTAYENPSGNYFTLYGALVGGPDIRGVYIDKRSDFVSNEVATDFNAGFQSAVAGLKYFQIENRRG